MKRTVEFKFDIGDKVKIKIMRQTATIVECHLTTGGFVYVVDTDMGIRLTMPESSLSA